MKYLITAMCVLSIIGSAACTANPPAPPEVTVSNDTSTEFLDQWTHDLTHPPTVVQRQPQTWQEMLLPPTESASSKGRS